MNKCSDNRATCQSCADSMAQRESHLTAERKSKGLCTQCNMPAVVGKSMCENHRQILKLKQAARVATRLASGLCRHSCNELAVGKSNLCKQCYFKNKAFHNLGSSKHAAYIEELWIKQNAHCYYCADIMTLGIDSEIDHKRSRQQHPEEFHNKENVVWACHICNETKRGQDAEEFIARSRKVAATWPL